MAENPANPVWVGEGPPVNPTPAPSGRSGMPPPVAYQFRKGNKTNGGRPLGSSTVTPLLRELAKGAVIDDETGEVLKYGDRAEEVAQVLYELATGKRDPSTVDLKAIIEIIERSDGPVARERITTFSQLHEGISLAKRDGPPPPLPIEEGR